VSRQRDSRAALLADPARTTEVPISAIRVGPRLRQDAGDVDYLAALIEAAGGILQPLLVTPDLVLLDGYRRLLAAKKLRMTHVPVRVVEVKEAAHANRP